MTRFSVTLALLIGSTLLLTLAMRPDFLKGDYLGCQIDETPVHCERFILVPTALGSIGVILLFFGVLLPLVVTVLGAKLLDQAKIDYPGSNRAAPFELFLIKDWKKKK